MSRFVLCCLFGFAVAPSLVHGKDEDPARTILAHAKQVNDARQHDEATQKSSMRIVSAGGRESTREIRTFTKRYGGDEKKTVAFFLGPTQVKDVAFLQYSHADHDAEQWLYLPAIKRVRRIATSIRDESFQGSDFSYRDLDIVQNILDWRENKATATFVRDEQHEGVACAVLDLVPHEPEGDYRRLRVWLDRSEQVMRRLEFFGDQDTTTLKVLELREYTPIMNVPVAQALEMHDARTDSTTFVRVSEVRYDLHLPDSFFTERTLEQGVATVAY
jgi:hypothetical protein